MSTNMRMKANKSDLIYPELSYQIMGILFKVHNKLGPEYQEKYYQRAIEIELKKADIPYEREKLVRLGYEGEKIGRYKVDFVIDKKIALETKAIDFFKKKDWRQVRGYLDSENLKLAILVNFSTPRLTYKRVINPRVKIRDH